MVTILSSRSHCPFYHDYVECSKRIAWLFVRYLSPMSYIHWDDQWYTREMDKSQLLTSVSPMSNIHWDNQWYTREMDKSHLLTSVSPMSYIHWDDQWYTREMDKSQLLTSVSVLFCVTFFVDILLCVKNKIFEKMSSTCEVECPVLVKLNVQYLWSWMSSTCEVECPVLVKWNVQYLWSWMYSTCEVVQIN